MTFQITEMVYDDDGQDDPHTTFLSVCALAFGAKRVSADHLGVIRDLAPEHGIAKNREMLAAFTAFRDELLAIDARHQRRTEA